MLSFNQSSPSYDIVCPGDTLVFTCITSGGGVVWRINTGSRTLFNNYNVVTLNSFILKITEINNTTSTLISTATSDSASLQLNGTVIDCSGDGVHFINALTVHIAGKIHNESYVTQLCIYV